MGTDLANGSQLLADVEEGEISDTASVEEITEDDFNKQDVKDAKQSTKPQKDTRVWTMKDLYKYQIRGGYVSGLYNLAWAQAVQNKPLNELFVDVEPDENNSNNNNNNNNNSKRSSPSSSIASVNSSGSKIGKSKSEQVLIDDSGDEADGKVSEALEKEEGELEEGEIDMDLEAVGEKAAGDSKECDDDNDGTMMNDDRLKVEALEKRVKSIREALETVTVVEVEKSFQGVCSKLHSALESLLDVVQESNVPAKNVLSQLAFTAVGVVNLVFSSMNHKLKEQNKEVFSRLHALVNRHDHHLFSPEQIKEMVAMVSSLDRRDDLLIVRSGEKEKESQIIGKANSNYNNGTAEGAAHDLITMNKSPSGTESSHTSLEASKAGLSTFRSRVLPLLDLHKDHDLDSLPSPTRETAPSFPVQRVLIVGDGMLRTGFPTAKVVPDARESRMHPYETDAFKAFSSYQQKFGVSSLFSSDRLPSPTPSEGASDGDGDTGGEVSSSSTANYFRNVNLPTVSQSIAPPSPPIPENVTLHGVNPVISPAPVNSGSSSTMKASAKSRDPRLRYVNTDASTVDHDQRALSGANNSSKVELINLKKQKSVEDPIVDAPALKRQKNAWESSGVMKDPKTVTGTGGWLEDTDMIGPQTISRNELAENVECDPRRMDIAATCSSIGAGAGTSNFLNNVNEQKLVRGPNPVTGSEPVPTTSTSGTSLPDLLKDIAVNPTILINILKMGQQQRLALESQSQTKVTDSAKNTSQPLPSDSIPGVLPVTSVAPPLPSRTSLRPAGKIQVPSQTNTVDEMGKVRMKPRDPRRILHNNTLQRSGSMGPEQFKTDGSSPSTPGSKDFQDVHKQDFEAEAKTVLPQPFVLPDISLQFTKSLKNIANIVSVSQASTTQSLVSKNLVSEPMQNKSDKVDLPAVMLNSGNQTGAALAASSQNKWEDVEHLFEGYDDKQKAAIQRERARRMEEQKKMFSARKLCLVLDLDHTLLNSAKFMEVDPMHDEILRKKEEQDREKPYRHLFRFPHMGMWTKLRPGIWNFLERASKLYELHLYTMGNKLYATEMAKVLDPKGVLFSGRVISRGDDGDPFDSDERVPKSKDLEGVLGMESAVVIIDDSVRVWPHNKLNLIVVERYTYFPCSRRQFGLPGPSLLEIDHDERPEDGTLACSLSVIERIHQNFFSHHSLDDVDVRNILASEQRKILGGCRILFSRVFPVGEANPHLHPLWQTAEQFGAICVNQIDEQVTHVVANSLGTDKVNWALSTGRFVVHPGWVEASALLYRRANEQDFAIKP